MKNFTEFLVVALIGVIALVLFIVGSQTEEAPLIEVNMAETFGSQLVEVEDGKLVRVDGERLKKAKYIGLYFSAGWCGPCRQFTPKLAAFYRHYSRLYDDFEIIYISRDNSVQEMVKSMKKMPWPALAAESDDVWAKIELYAGRGIPNLVLVNAEGNVISGSYVGPNVVMRALEAKLQDSHPHVAAQ